MSLWYLVIREVRYRAGAFLLGVAAVAVATGCAVGALAMLEVHELHSRQVLEAQQAELEQRLAQLDDQVRKSLLKLGFNIVILPAEQPLAEWYAQGAGSHTMPEAYAEQLSAASVATIQHLLPMLQQKLVWPEQRRTILLVGTRGEVPILHRDPKKPLLEAVPAGGAIVGYQLHRDLGLKVGDPVPLLGTEFRVAKLHPERGTADDITIWIGLADAQRLLGMPGLINAIQALECKCAWADLPQVRAEIAKILPGTQVIELSGQALARAETRRQVEVDARVALDQAAAGRATLQATRERLAGLLVPCIVLACGIWIGLSMLGNVRERRGEIALFGALGCLPGRVLGLFLAKALAMGLAGGLVGAAGGLRLGRWLGETLAGAAIAELPPHDNWFWGALAMAVGLSLIASWLPALFAARQNPADILREE